MQNLNKVLVIIDKPKHEQVAMNRGLALQRRSGAHLHLAAFAYHPMYDQKDIFEAHQRRAIRKEILRSRTQWLRDQVLDAGAAFNNLELEVVWTKDIAGWATDFAHKGRYDLVLKSIDQSQTLLHTPVDWQLLRESPAPVLLCTATPWRRSSRVLAAVDLRSGDSAHAKLNRKVLDAARLFCRVHGSELHCVYAIDVPKALSDLAISDPRHFAQQAQQQALERLAALAADYDIRSSNVHVPLGKVGHAVNRLSARLNADLVVIGTTARKRLKGLVIGNSAEKVLTRARCDVLAVKP